MDNYFYINLADPNVSSFSPIKALNAEVWLLKRQSAEESPNYYWTTNFTKVSQVSDCYPERKFIWLKSKLCNYGLFNGKPLKGVLFFPDDMEQSKRYPTIIHCYERKSNLLNIFPTPQFATGSINVSWFVNRGYVVFTPDVDFNIGTPGTSALDCIQQAVSYLSGLDFIDSSRLGIQGHSFGGYETNYIVANSGSFKAAVSASAPSNLISWYGSLYGNHTAGFMLESGQMRIRKTLWEDGDLYIKNSPLFKASEIKTPVLLISNQNDRTVPFSQGLEFFLALRRLRKPVWFLQYEGEGHTLSKIANKQDLTTRMDDFFDHYLKDDPLPDWMNADN